VIVVEPYDPSDAHFSSSRPSATSAASTILTSSTEPFVVPPCFRSGSAFAAATSCDRSTEVVIAFGAFPFFRYDLSK
jgi:hypothetical protein